MHIPKWLIATAALVLVALIAAVAFFIGRQTTASPTSVSETAPASPITSPSSVSAVIEAPSAAASSSLPSTSAPVSVAGAVPATNEARERVSAYFAQMDLIQSGGPGGDPEAFARTLLQGTVNGDFSGIDDLVRVAGDAERRAAAVQPPVECAEYHRMAVALLQESRTMIIALRDGLKRNDTDTLTALGATAQTMKSRADALAAAEKALRARVGL